MANLQREPSGFGDPDSGVLAFSIADPERMECRSSLAAITVAAETFGPRRIVRQ
jgi:hypothetical protein